MATADSKAPEEDIKNMEEVENENENPTLAKDDCDGASADEKKDVDEKMDVEKEISARTGFTSEEFKVELNGLPRFFGIGQAKKLFRSKGVDFHKIKPVGKQATYMFVNFKNEEEREKAIAIMDGLLVKGRKIKAFKVQEKKHL